MNNDLFRKESLNNISSPEQLNDYIRVSNPSIWLVLLAVTILLASFLTWCFIGELPSTIDANAIIKDNKAVCYISQDQASNLKQGMKVNFSDGSKGNIADIDTIPLSAEEVSQELNSDYIYKNLCTSDWNVKVIIALTFKANNEDNLVDAKITVNTVKPISFLLN